MHCPEQQSPFAAQAEPPSSQGSVQWPPTHWVEQQSVFVVHTSPVGTQVVGLQVGGVPEQSSPQHSALKLQL